MLSEIERHIYNLLDQVRKKDDLDQISYDLSALGDFFSYKTVNETFGEDFEAKKQVIARKIGNVQSEILRYYFSSVVDQNNLSLFEPGRFKAFIQDFDTIAKKIIFVQLTTAIELKPEDLHDLSEKMSKRMQCWVKVDPSVDKSIIGGAIIKNDNYILDYSLKTRLGNFGSEWKRSLKAKDSNA